MSISDDDFVDFRRNENSNMHDFLKFENVPLKINGVDATFIKATC